MSGEDALVKLRSAATRAVGAHQTTRAIARGQAVLVVVAGDADRRVIDPVVQAAAARGVQVVEVDSMTALGRACGIAVGAAAGAVLVEGPPSSQS